jgi:excisionase family DNA binding protein
MTHLTIAQAATLAGVHPTRVRRLVREGRIAGEKFGAAWMVSEISLRVWMADAQQHRPGRRAKERNG